MATDLTVVLPDKPGQLALLGDTLGEAGINIEGMCAMTGEGKGFVHVLVGDGDRASDALEGAGLGVAGRKEALVVDAADNPGTLGELGRMLAEAGINIETAYTTYGDGVRIVIVTDDLASARAALA